MTQFDTQLCQASGKPSSPRNLERCISSDYNSQRAPHPPCGNRENQSESQSNNWLRQKTSYQLCSPIPC
ncbi:MAG TPA: hypothetical protein VGH31_07315, partial [Acidimicrobiales bacterium]